MAERNQPSAAARNSRYGPTMSAAASRNRLRRLLKHVRPRRKHQLLLLLVLMLAGACAELLSLGAVIPFVTVLANPEAAARIPAVARVMAELDLRTSQLPMAISFAFASLVLLAMVARLGLLWATIRFGNGLGAEISCDLYSKTLQRPYSFHVSRNTSQIIGSMNKVQRVIVSYVLPLLNGIIGLLLALSIIAVLVAVEPAVAIGGALIFGASYFAIAMLVRKRLRRDGAIIAAANDRRIQAIQEGLGGIRDVILDRAHAVYTRRFSKIEQQLRGAQAGTQFYSAFPRLAIEAIGMLLLVGFAVYFSGTGRDFGALLPVLGVMAVGAQKLMPLVQQVYAGWSSLVTTQASLDDVLGLLEFDPPKQAEPGTIEFNDQIRIDRVSFHYGSAAESAPVLQDIDLTIRRGEKIGIVGATGSGKSTLADLLMGLLSPTGGSFTADGDEITPNHAAAWQRHIAHVPQSIYLSDATIAENIAFGMDPKKIDQALLEASARTACIHDHVMSLPQGYRTQVGERGVRLSGGQRQRIGIARALYKRVGILVLDEATSALDDDTESQVMAGISESASAMTVIMIAHRLTTMRRCDRIVHLENGRIARITSYDELMASRAGD